MNNCQCPTVAWHHSANGCTRMGTIRAERDGVELLLCGDCILAEDVRLDEEGDDDEADGFAQVGPAQRAYIVADGRHPCAEYGCEHTVLFDDEPYCYTHSPDEGSSVRGYSYLAAQAARQR